MRGFEAASGLLSERIRVAGEARGFAVARLLTQWDEIAGEALAAMARPVRIGYGRGGMGATLTLLCRGAEAPVVQMELPRLRERVNACYGYNAISRITITQTASEGFAEGQATFLHAPARRSSPVPDPETSARAGAVADGIGDTGLRDALAQLALNVFSRSKSQKG